MVIALVLLPGFVLELLIGHLHTVFCRGFPLGTPARRYPVPLLSNPNRLSRVTLTQMEQTRIQAPHQAHRPRRRTAVQYARLVASGLADYSRTPCAVRFVLNVVPNLPLYYMIGLSMGGKRIQDPQFPPSSSDLCPQHRLNYGAREKMYKCSHTSCWGTGVPSLAGGSEIFDRHLHADGREVSLRHYPLSGSATCRAMNGRHHATKSAQIQEAPDDGEQSDEAS